MTEIAYQQKYEKTEKLNAYIKLIVLTKYEANLQITILGQIYMKFKINHNRDFNILVFI